MRRAFAILLVLGLCACSAAAQTQQTRQARADVRSAAPREVAALIRNSPYYPALIEYDRQITALRALLHVPGLAHVPAAAAHGAAVARAQAAHAANAVASIAARAAPFEDREAAFDASGVQSSIERGYQREATRVRDRARSAQAAYGSALNEQVAVQSATLARALDRRVSDAYAARAQQYIERENQAAVEFARSVAGRQLQLRIELAALARSPAQRRALEDQLAAIAGSLAAAQAAGRARDDAALAAYRQSLQAAATAEYDATLADLQRRAAANRRIRGRVTNAQVAAPPRLTLPFGRAFDADMHAGLAGLHSLQGTAATNRLQTRADFDAAGNDIARRLTTIAGEDAAGQASLRAELAAMERARAALYDAIAASLIQTQR